MKRRHLLAAGFGALAAPAVVRADARFPDRTIRLIVPFPAGGATDVVGRMFADKLTHQLGQTVIFISSTSSIIVAGRDGLA
jgi:tripartite-type tricarboxylate transporter receptor subunit TctC